MGFERGIKGGLRGELRGFKGGLRGSSPYGSPRWLAGKASGEGFKVGASRLGIEIDGVGREYACPLVFDGEIPYLCMR